MYGRVITLTARGLLDDGESPKKQLLRRLD
jgi:hypothetical protein